MTSRRQAASSRRTAAPQSTYKEKMKLVRLELVRHKGLIATTSVALFCFASYFLIVSVVMLFFHAKAAEPSDSLAVRMGFHPINIAVTLMAMGVGCATVSMALAFSIEDINWA
ncbi:uncharacterized protein LOC121047102 [Ixodes scapularis]|uniref:uncharacterized protein LOC121047102 n=1 Tax=Ixodes scapularis TaxID=6945 RepID=UPI001AD6455E|nr:uncharacterized protein LOC121047102 [Ixodes scapularis]